MLLAAAHAFHWFNPLVRMMQKEAAVDMELSCDECVVQGADYAERKAYTETLLSALHKQNARRTELSTQFYGGKQIMKKRFRNILIKTRKKNGAVILISVILTAAALGTLVGCSVKKRIRPGAAGRQKAAASRRQQIENSRKEAAAKIRSREETAAKIRSRKETAAKSRSRRSRAVQMGRKRQTIRRSSPFARRVRWRKNRRRL